MAGLGWFEKPEAPTWAFQFGISQLRGGWSVYDADYGRLSPSLELRSYPEFTYGDCEPKVVEGG